MVIVTIQQLNMVIVTMVISTTGGHRYIVTMVIFTASEHGYTYFGYISTTDIAI